MYLNTDVRQAREAFEPLEAVKQVEALFAAEASKQAAAEAWEIS